MKQGEECEELRHEAEDYIIQLEDGINNLNDLILKKDTFENKLILDKQELQLNINKSNNILKFKNKLLFGSIGLNIITLLIIII
jgi:hypothetical protein